MKEGDPRHRSVGLAVGRAFLLWGRLEEVLEGLWDLEGAQLKVGSMV